MLHLRTFGGLALERDGIALEGVAVRRRSLTLLAFVASHGDVGVSRESVLADFWPESDAARARNSLKQTVFGLRRDLGVDVFVPGASATLRVERQTLAVDVLDLADALDRDDVDAAVALYRGPFLDGVAMPGRHHLERWAERERERFAWACARALEVIATRATAASDHAAAVVAWRRRAALDPLSGQAAAGLMRALRDAGDSTAALEHWRVHAMLVREELGAAPDPSVAALAEEVRGGAAAPPSPAPAAPPVVPPTAATTPAPTLAPAALVAAVAPARVTVSGPAAGHPGGRWWLQPRAVRAMLVVVLAAVVAPAARQLTAGTLPTSAEAGSTVVAVLPFTVHGSAVAADARLGQGVADILSGAIHGAGAWTAVAPAALLADDAVRAAGGLSTTQAREVARRFGAGRYVLGDVVRDGQRLHLAASLHDSDGRVLAQAHAVATDGRLGEACEALARSLLAPQRPSRLAGTAGARASS